MPGASSLNAVTPPSHAAAAAPSPWVARWLPGARAGGRVLDFACGSGRHTRFAADLGFSVLAVDRDPAALSSLQGTGVRLLQEDLEGGRWSFAAERFDAVICTNYLYRPRLGLLCGLLQPGGMLLYETFAIGNARYGRPSNPAYLLRRGELAASLQRAGLHLLAFEDGFAARPGPARIQCAVALCPPFEPQDLPLV